MEYWLRGTDEVEKNNLLLDCQLYSAILGRHTHFTSPRNIITIKVDTVFEGVEAISMLDNKQYILDLKNDKNNTYFELIGHFIKNKDIFPNIQTVSTLQCDKIEEINNYAHQAVVAISYGIDYILIDAQFDIGLKLGSWLAKFRDKGLYKTRIIINDAIYFNSITQNSNIFYDGVFWSNNMLIAENNVFLQ